MVNFLLLFSHKLTQEQITDTEKMQVSLIYLPEDLQKAWSNFSPESEKVDVEIFEEWLLKNSQKGDFVLVQGDFGAVYKLVNFCFLSGLIPVYATTKRETTEKEIPGGKMEKISVFRHVRFRKFERNENHKNTSQKIKTDFF
ncbi:hypothetical protein IT568_01635 [bacterium]|nr:hypothetical protein [bacterium]